MPNPGALRFNTDSLKLELFDGNQWTEIVATSPDAQTGGARGLFGAGSDVPGTLVNTIDYVTISTTGNAIDFGDFTFTGRYRSASASSTRGVWGGGYTPSNINNIDFVTISSTGNAADFGDLTAGRPRLASCSSSTRGLFGAGSPLVNIVDYITIASTGDARDFGDLTQSRNLPGACSNGHGGL